MESGAGNLTVTLSFEGEKTQFRLGEPPRCGHHAQLQLTGTVYETWPRQFEVKCNCGCGYQGMAYSVNEEEASKYLRS